MDKIAKRGMDVIGSATLLLVAAPLMALIALAIFIDSGRPILFSQTRVGRNFVLFRIWKFRSMIQRPGERLITVAGDTRITPIGRLLRATKLDELPQLWNVLTGNMSLVGPRPEVPRYVEMFRSDYELILTVCPGLTDLASLRFRNEEKVLAEEPDPIGAYVQWVLPEKLALATEYIREWTFWKDLSILFQTAGALTGLFRLDFRQPITEKHRETE